MNGSIRHSIEVFKSFSSNSIYTMASVKYWLGEYDQLYFYAKRNYRERGIVDGILTYGGYGSILHSFILLYENLSTLSLQYSYEPYFNEEVTIYDKINGDIPCIKLWLERNEDLATNLFLLFTSDNFDSAPHGNDNYKNLYLSNELFGDSNIIIDRKEFRYTIKFLKIFNKWYWRKNLLERVWPKPGDLSEED